MPQRSNSIVPERLQARRQRQGLTQEQLAEAADMSRPALARIESGRRLDPRLSTALRLAVALDCPLDWLVGREVQP